MFVSICTKGEPWGEGEAGSRACPPHPYAVTAQPHSPVPLGASASPLPGASLLLGGCSLSLVHVQVPHLGLVGSPRDSQRGVPPVTHSMGTEPAQLMEKVGLRRVCGCSGRGGCTGGRMTLERS